MLVAQLVNTAVAEKYRITLGDRVVVAAANTYEDITNDWNLVKTINPQELGPDTKVSAKSQKPVSSPPYSHIVHIGG